MTTGQALTRPGCTIVVQPVGSQTKPTLLTRAVEMFRRLELGSADVQTPDKLAATLQRVQQNIAVAFRPLAENPLASMNILQGVVFTAGQTQYLQHLLGRPYLGWWCLRARGNPALLVEVALPTGANAAQLLPIQSTNAGTYDLGIF